MRVVVLMGPIFGPNKHLSTKIYSYSIDNKSLTKCRALNIDFCYCVIAIRGLIAAEAAETAHYLIVFVAGGSLAIAGAASNILPFCIAIFRQNSRICDLI